ncbi:hypothetical protein SBRCBS47491_003617 [Sporothrix bragantina]|uniref:C2H2-type domain-containing protein n=1 Tax=Sporothrix bragantina TaxID=671064 RepID=A0ABP0BGI6_9PEZI
MTSTRQHARNAQYGRVSGANAIFDPQQPAFYNNTNASTPASLTVPHSEFLPGDHADAGSDADADGDLDITDNTDADATINTNTTAAARLPSVAGMPSICHSCGRQFKRPCDLNRHTRTHTRPFKCQVPMCKYVVCGFPTSQELQRHMDDRHSDKAPTFHCSFQGCKYSSKRESNCKQHMEKTHNWVYDRTRHSNKGHNQTARTGSNEEGEKELADRTNLEAEDDEVMGEVLAKQEGEEPVIAGAAAAMITPVAASSTLSPTMEDYAMHQQQMQQFLQHTSASATPMPVVGTDADWTLYPGETQQPQQSEQSVLGNGGVVYSNANSPGMGIAVAGSNSYVPWESPLTQQEEISNLIRTATNRLPSQHVAAQSVASPVAQAVHPTHGIEAQRHSSTSVYPQAIGWFTPGNYHVAQVPLPASVPGSAVASAAAFSPPTPSFMGTSHLFQQQQSAVHGSSPHTPLVTAQSPFLPQGNMGSFPQAWAVMMPSNAEAHRQILQQQQQQQQQKFFEEQSAVLRQEFRAQAQTVKSLVISADAEATQSPVDANTATDRGIKRTRDAYEGDASNTAQAGNDNDDDHYHDNDEDHDDDESEHNGRRPPQPPRTTHNDNDDIDDDHMPCPYHRTDPEYFYRDNEERFSPCHTQHRYISTLFRHLGRAAHNLIITENSASSFGVYEAGNRPQRQAGLCRRCWTSFTDEAAFNAHTVGGRPCARASRSKREKYSQILHTFCAPRPTLAPTTGPIVVRPPTAPAAPTPIPAAPIERNTIQPTARLQVVPSASVRRGTVGDPRSPDVKVSPTQQEALARANILADRSPNLHLQGRGQGRPQSHHPHQPHHPHHKINNSVESATLVDADYYVSRSEYESYTQSINQRMNALEAIVQRMDAAAPQRSAVSASGGGGGASSSSTRPPSSLGLGPARSIVSVALQTDASAHERGSLVREMDRQTILEEDEDDDEVDDLPLPNRHDAHRRRLNHRHREARVQPSADASQTLAGIGEPLRTLSGLSSSSNGSSVLHVPPPASVAEDNSRVRKQRHQQLQQQQQQLLLLEGDDITVGATSNSQQPHLLDPANAAQLSHSHPSEHQLQQHHEVETLLDTAAETVADSGYGSNDKDVPQPGTLPVLYEVLPPPGKVGVAEVRGNDTQHSSQNAIDAIDDGVQPPSMFADELRDDFDEADLPW